MKRWISLKSVDIASGQHLIRSPQKSRQLAAVVCIKLQKFYIERLLACPIDSTQKKIATAKKSHAKWQSQNKEKISKAAKAWKENNKERRKQADKEWTQNNPEKVRERGRRRRARKYNAVQNAIITVTHEDIELLKQAFDQSCVYCGSKEKLTIDHIIPLARDGAHDIANLLPCCKSCNSSKNCSPVQSWYRSKPFFSEQRWEAIVKFHPWLGIS
jgi:5-methylcytosine-specific restriction endonuclease McrA